MVNTIVVGGGPSGMMAAITIAEAGIKVLLLEKNNGLGKKLLASGGGRCNITNQKPISELIQYMSDRFLYKSLSQFGPLEIVRFFERQGVKLEEEDNNRIFPASGKALDILNALKKQIHELKVQIQYEEVLKIEKEDTIFLVQTSQNTYQCQNVVIATGGLTYPSLGSTGDGYHFARKFNHNVTETYPANTPLVSNDSFIQERTLQGISLVDAILKYHKTSFRGAMIFTHFGISGPIALNMSKEIYEDLKTGTVTLHIDLIPNINKEILHQEFTKAKSIEIMLRMYLSKRLAEYILNESDTAKNISEISKNKMNHLITLCKEFPITITQTKGFDSAIVTAGGVSIKEIHPNTMESRKVANLYFVGEVLDLDGKSGGYNHTIALSTGYTAGKSIIKAG